MIVLVTDDDGRALLARGTRFPIPMYSCLAGFVEPGETCEEAVHREVREEVGIAVRDVAYWASQPWPFPHSLMIGCLGRAESTEITIDSGEIADARWFSREDARLMLEKRHPDGLNVPGRQAIANALLASFVETA
jgi:NAD+ diphosphatase